MRWSILIWFAVILSVSSSGCAPTAGSVPSASQVEKIQLAVTQFPWNGGPQVTCDVTLTEQTDVAEVLTWLKGIDWSQKGHDLKVIDLPPPDGHLKLVLKEGAARDYSFYWDGGFTDAKSDRYLQAGDMTKLKTLIQRVCK